MLQNETLCLPIYINVLKQFGTGLSNLAPHTWQRMHLKLFFQAAVTQLRQHGCAAMIPFHV